MEPSPSYKWAFSPPVMGVAQARLWFHKYRRNNFLLSCISLAIEQDFIIYKGAKTTDLERVNVATEHVKLLEDVCGVDGHSKLKHVYHRSFDGFVARLTNEEASAISEREDVVSVFPNKKMELTTTRSWDFLGLTTKAKRTSKESDIIIGMLDSGIWPESESFIDHGLGPPPSKWKGVCQSSSDFSCNNKIIGARWYNLLEIEIDNRVLKSPRDSTGHGTHTASTAAGVPTKNTTNFFGLASGTARGAVPRARLAIYKVCWSSNCNTVDILAAFDDAVADGVDIISISIGNEKTIDYKLDVVAIASFHAMQQGILTVASAGNMGPNLETVDNVAPWIFTVAASTIDRKFTTEVSSYPLIWRSLCYEDERASGKIIACQTGTGSSSSVVSLGVKGFITMNDCRDDAYEVTAFSQLCVPEQIGSKIHSYINISSEPMARILKSSHVIDMSAPKVADFSSRGPNPISPQILKPDISAPGVNILAAWPDSFPPTKVRTDHRVTKYNLKSGTSMACPHVSGVAAYVKEFNPTFSPAAIKSAIMTTAKRMTRQDNAYGEFAYGSGQINPHRAISPGLVYDISESSYAAFLCANGYKTKELRLITRDKSRCPKNVTKSTSDLNYPSLTLVMKSKLISGIFRRTLTNVEKNASTYNVKVLSSPSMSLTVKPKALSFKYLGQNLS
ncbi:hypothetical protein RND81_03G171000 [Saponaria officinalis]|uniref:Uncharacterized protein n=1 Tax=Saponaria officinalis TaxID=3572 RepID=A0AAW1M108_SAPOF